MVRDGERLCLLVLNDAGSCRMVWDGVVNGGNVRDGA